MNGIGNELGVKIVKRGIDGSDIMYTSMEISEDGGSDQSSETNNINCFYLC